MIQNERHLCVYVLIISLFARRSGRGERAAGARSECAVALPEPSATASTRGQGGVPPFPPPRQEESTFERVSSVLTATVLGSPPVAADTTVYVKGVPTLAAPPWSPAVLTHTTPPQKVG